MRAVVSWCLIGCVLGVYTVVHAQGESALNAGYAPPHVIQAFRLRFQQRDNRWGCPDRRKMSAILRDVDTALKQYPKDPRVNWWHAMALRELGRYKEAAKEFERIWQSDNPMRSAAFAFFVASLWQDGQHRRAWQYLKPFWADLIWQRVEPAVTTAALAVVTFLVFWKRPEAKRLLLVILVLAWVLFVTEVVQCLLAWGVQGYPFMSPDYPPGGWVALGTGCVVWLLLWLVTRLLGAAPRTSEGMSPIVSVAFSLLLMGALVYAVLRAGWADLRPDKVPLIAESTTIPFMLYGVLNATFGAMAKGRFMVLTLYATLRESFGGRWGSTGIALAWMWYTVLMVFGHGIPASYGELRGMVLFAGWGIAAALLWEGCPSRWCAYLPYTFSSLLRTVIAAFRSLGGVIP